MEAHMRLLEADPDMRKPAGPDSRRGQPHAPGRHRVEARRRKRRITIPVVVHVVYRTRREHPEAQINSQIAALNRDYRATNPDASKCPGRLAGPRRPTRIQFELATKDPKGRPTTGSRARRPTQARSVTDDSVKYGVDGRRRRVAGRRST